MHQNIQEQLHTYQALRQSAVLKKVSDFLLGAVVSPAIRATIIWVGAMLVGPTAFGLPEITWPMALGCVLIVRTLITQTVGVQQQVDPSLVMGIVRASMMDVAQSMVAEDHMDERQKGADNAG